MSEPINLEGIGKVQPKDKKRRPKHKSVIAVVTVVSLSDVGASSYGTSSYNVSSVEEVQGANEVFDIAKYWDNLLTGEFAGFKLQRSEAKATDGELGNYKGGYRQVCTEDRKKSRYYFNSSRCL